ESLQDIQVRQSRRKEGRSLSPGRGCQLMSWWRNRPKEVSKGATDLLSGRVRAYLVHNAAPIATPVNSHLVGVLMASFWVYAYRSWSIPPIQGIKLLTLGLNELCVFLLPTVLAR